MLGSFEVGPHCLAQRTCSKPTFHAYKVCLRIILCRTSMLSSWPFHVAKNYNGMLKVFCPWLLLLNSFDLYKEIVDSLLHLKPLWLVQSSDSCISSSQHRHPYAPSHDQHLPKSQCDEAEQYRQYRMKPGLVTNPARQLLKRRPGRTSEERQMNCRTPFIVRWNFFYVKTKQIFKMENLRLGKPKLT
jgi:hypothetical protein